MAKSPVDMILLVAVLLLLVFSVCFVYTASSARAERDSGDSAFFLKRQLVRLTAGLVLLAAFSRVNYRQVIRFAPPVYWLTLVLLIALLFAPESWMIRGSRRWFMLGNIRFQPSELAKLSLILYLAANLTKPNLKLREFTDGLMPQLILIGMVVLAVALEPDMGSALLIAASAAFMLFVSGARLQHLFLLATSGILAAVMLMWRVAYQRGRLESFIETLTGQADPAWQVKQSLIGLGNGGLLGLGLGQSKQKFLFLPDPFTDFIMSIIGEELGLIGTMTVVGLFGIILWRGYRISQRSTDPAAKLAALGITWTIGLNAVINIAVVTNLLPTTGVPLPFVSYGGSALVVNLIAVGVLLNMSTFLPKQGRTATGYTKIPLATVNWYRDRKR